MKWMAAGILLVVMAGCAPEAPVPLDRPDLGIAVTFPGKPQGARLVTPTPYGEIEWFSHSWHPGGRLDEDFHTAVGNLPPGDRGGDTPDAVLRTHQAWLRKRFGALERTDVPVAKGPGFQYRAPGPGGSHIAGIVVVRRGRLHIAEATVRKAGDPRVAAFLDSFSVR